MKGSEGDGCAIRFLWLHLGRACSCAVAVCCSYSRRWRLPQRRGSFSKARLPSSLRPLSRGGAPLLKGQDGSSMSLAKWLWARAHNMECTLRCRCLTTAWSPTGPVAGKLGTFALAEFSLENTSACGCCCRPIAVLGYPAYFRLASSGLRSVWWASSCSALLYELRPMKRATPDPVGRWRLGPNPRWPHASSLE